VAGIVVFGLSGIGDLTWHTIFGIERGIAALLSPTHLGLITGAFQVVTTPFRAALADGLIPRSGGWRLLGPAVASMSLAGLVLAFIFQNVAQFSQNQFVSLGIGRDIAGFPYIPGLVEWHTDALVFAFLIDSLFLFGPWLLLARSYRPPRFSLFLLIATQATLLQAIRGFADPGLIIAAVISGLVAEVLVTLLAPRPDDYRRLRLTAFLLPLVFWGMYLGLIAAHDHGKWRSGVGCENAPQLPLAENRGRDALGRRRNVPNRIYNEVVHEVEITAAAAVFPIEPGKIGEAVAERVAAGPA